jgi:ParB family chromosome partitioning protein
VLEGLCYTFHIFKAGYWFHRYNTLELIAKTSLGHAEVTERIEISLIKPPMYLLRDSLDDLSALVQSIKTVGLLQPLVIRPARNSLELVCGSRRLAACKILRWNSVPCIVRQLDDREAFEVSVIENIQRKSLDPVEEANAFRRYVEEAGWGGVSELASRIGKSAEYVSHRISLLKLSPEILDQVKNGKISTSVAYELLGLGSGFENEQRRIAHEAVKSRYSSRAVRRMVNVIKDQQERNVLDQPDFLRLQLHSQSHADDDDKIVKAAILVLTINLVRLDALLEETKTDRVREFLRNQRLAVHDLIDHCIKFRQRRLAENGT